jgi:hypothetical protein
MRACGELSYTVLQQVQINFIFNDNVNILLQDRWARNQDNVSDLSDFTDREL